MFSFTSFLVPIKIKKHPIPIMPTDIFSLVISGDVKKSATNSGPQISKFLIRMIPAITINKTPIAVNQFLLRL
ncbi:MAG TPA: hypothetical protein VEU72_02965 [Nitrosopumilaceae archaeon]|nr:hypothetical protein [Nitrosopumilaceae archaeon]